MKSPLKYSKWPIVFSFLVGFFIIGITFNSFLLSGGTVTPLRIIASIGFIIIYTLVGWGVSIHFTGTFLHRKVDNPVKLSKIVAQNTYWLNGQTEAIYLGVMDHTGKYLFHIKGLNKNNNLLDAKDLNPTQVVTYISEVKEV